MEELRPGLWRWLVPHPEWKPSPASSPGGWDRMVGCLRYESPAPGAPLVLIDPLAPEGAEAASFWQTLDEAVHRFAAPIAVVISNSFHHRSTSEVVQRYRQQPGVEVWAHQAARAHLEKAGCPVTRWFSAGEILPADIEAHDIEGLCPGEVALFLPQLRVLVVADALLGQPDGQVRVPPISWSADHAAYRQNFRPAVRRLLGLPFQTLVVSHGAPVLSRAREVVAEALEAPDSSGAAPPA